MSRVQRSASVSPRAAGGLVQRRARKGARVVLPAVLLLCAGAMACFGGAGLAVASPPSTAIRYVYDGDGHLKGLVVPGSETALYGWDAAGNLTSVALKQSKSLSVIELTPAQGAVGETVTISGTGFSTKPSSDTVKFNGTAATVSAATEWALTVTVPKGATSGTVSVQTSEGPLSSAQKFVVMSSLAPTITSISTSKALAGETITVNGTNFETNRVDDIAKVNQSMPVISSVTSSSFQLTVPSAAGGGHVSVATPQGSVVGPDLFIPPEGLPVSKVETTGRLSLGGTETVKLPVAEKVDLELFDGTVGQRVSLVASESSITHGYVSLWGPHGEKLTYNEGFREGEEVLIGPITLPSTGTYTIMITPLETYTGSVKLQTDSVVDQTGEVKPTVEGAKAGVSITTPGQRAVFLVPGTTGEEVSLTTSSTSFTGSYYVEWYNAAGERIYQEYWRETQDKFFPDQKFAGNETYTLIVRGGGASTGSTTITAYNASTVTGSITPGGEAVKLTVAAPGQKTRIKFPATESQLLTLVASEVTVANGRLSVWTPEETVLSGSETYFASGAKDEFTPSSTGTYTILVSPEEADTGSMTLTLYEGSHGPIRRRALDGPPAVSAPQLKVANTAGDSAYVSPKAASVAREARGKASRPRVERRASAPLGYTRVMLRFRAVGAGGWSPPLSRHRGLSGAWDSLQPTTPWTQAPPLQGREGETALAGQVLALDGLPLAGVRLSIEGTYVASESDSGGRFLLSGLPAGHQVLVIEGDTVPGHASYGTYETGVELVAGRTTALQYTIWLTPLDPAGEHRIPSPTTHEVRLTTPQVPGLEVRLPAGSVITAADGKVVHDLNITAIPVDRPPFPLPAFVSVPVYFTVQPGRAYVSKGAQIVYPNWDHLPPGQRVDFWDYDADKRGWYVYGEGTVTRNGKQVMPDPGVRVWELSGAMISGKPKPPKKGPKGKDPHGGDPVDLQTGLFLTARPT